MGVYATHVYSRQSVSQACRQACRQAYRQADRQADSSTGRQASCNRRERQEVPIKQITGCVLSGREIRLECAVIAESQNTGHENNFTGKLTINITVYY